MKILITVILAMSSVVAHAGDLDRLENLGAGSTLTVVGLPLPANTGSVALGDFSKESSLRCYARFGGSRFTRVLTGVTVVITDVSVDSFHQFFITVSGSPTIRSIRCVVSDGFVPSIQNFRNSIKPFELNVAPPTEVH